LKEKHNLKREKLIQTTLNIDAMPPKPINITTFRVAFAELVAKQYLVSIALALSKYYLPFSLIEENALHDAFLIFHKQWVENKYQPAFVTDKLFT
jgi:hypothetical protein